jgi:excisionase family DNA binding protein
MATPFLMTANEAAEQLSISRSKLYLLLATGEIKSILIGGSRRIASTDLADFIARKREESDAALAS